MRVPVDGYGSIDQTLLSACVNRGTALVGVRAVNYEFRPLRRRTGMPCSTWSLFDIYRRIPLDVEDANMELMAISNRKALGPWDASVLCIRGRCV